MHYRGDWTSLRLRCEVLEREMGELASQVRELEPSHERWLAATRKAEAARHELAAARMQLEAMGPKSLPVLENVNIASPCSASWDEMPGDERIRFCKGCSKNVYNLSAMTRAEAEALVQRSRDLCVRLYRREDGSILTGDCSVGVRKKKRRRAALAVGGGIMAAGALVSAGVAARKSPSPVASRDVSAPIETVATPPPPPTSPVPPPRVPTTYPMSPGRSGWTAGAIGSVPNITPSPQVVTPGQGTVNDGGLTGEQVRRVVMAHTGALRACYETEAQRQPLLRGGVTVSFTVEANGSVSQAAIQGSTLENARVEGCVLRQIKAWRFPVSGQATTVSGYPFRFGVGG